MLVQCIIAILILYTLKIVFNRIRANKQFKGFIKPPGHKILQHWYVFRDKKTMLPKLTDLTNTYGTRVRLGVGGTSALFVTDKEFLKLLLGTSTVMNKDDTYEKIETWLGTGLLTCKREKWEKTRKILTPAFHLQILEEYVCNFQHPISLLVKKLQQRVDQKPFDVYSLITLCTLDIICESAMGTKINAQSNEESAYVKSVKEMLRIVQDRSQSLVKSNNFLYVFSKDFWKERKVLNVLHGFTRDVINKKKAQKDANNENDGIKKRKLSFIDLLLEAKIGDRPMSDMEIAHEVDTFMFAGHDTTASAISFTLYCLSKNKNAQDLAQKELTRIFGEDGRYPTFQDLQGMHYLNLVIKESLRLYPPVPLYLRSSDVDTKRMDDSQENFSCCICVWCSPKP